MEKLSILTLNDTDDRPLTDLLGGELPFHVPVLLPEFIVKEMNLIPTGKSWPKYFQAGNLKNSK